MERRLVLPYESIEEIKAVNAGDHVLISGTLYVGRDQVHKRLSIMIEENEALPFSFKGNGIYYMGPSPKMPGYALGAAGPTTSQRMDPYSPLLMKHGLLVMVGKGPRKSEVVQAVKKYSGIYLQAFGGCGALYSERIKSAETVAFEDLGPEALLRLEVEDFPAICVLDSQGASPYF